MTPEIEKLLSSNLTDEQLRIISAAPELARALQMLVNELDNAFGSRGCFLYSVRKIARGTLTKAGLT